MNYWKAKIDYFNITITIDGMKDYKVVFTSFRYDNPSGYKWELKGYCWSKEHGTDTLGLSGDSFNPQIVPKEEVPESLKKYDKRFSLNELLAF